MNERIRNIAVGLIVREGWVLAEEYAATDQHPRFLRALGGGIDFGELAEDAVRREFAEELGVDLSETRLLAVTENRFTLAGRRGHEIVHVFAIRCQELEAMPVEERRRVLDSRAVAGWFRLDDLGDDTLPFYPQGIVEIARGLS
ncbi:NUDIX domain-containing protein [Microbacterium sp. H1-D42]|uniref:NUDIX domain-containing protein n=1 Tax=Microbacterium sp. H1-D42 TaxID=2925844 RepID=UPI001F533403|nr:NUDIX domain-containing protein [Microbacterium sp. H1-D42]UNK70269.1 NUDIX domain-containing protein [Microbacterium sp. H1-D42]